MPKAVVLGGYGLIGSTCMRALANAGFEVVGVGRSRQAAMAAAPFADWVIRDIPTITTDEWRALLTGVDVVVNASGALQDGARDDLEAIHVTMISRLVEAAAGRPVRIVQISAAGVSKSASTAFFRTKARGDEILSSGAEDWIILRPTLVLSPDAYGGTALLRAAAALPLVLPRILPDAQVQTVNVGDVASAVVTAVRGEVPSGTVADLTEHEARSFPELLTKVRRWQGWAPAVFHPAIPALLVSALGKGADLLGHLGWRSPLRTTALRALGDGIRGDPATWERAGGAPCQSLEQTLANLTTTRQERLFARAYLGLPLAIGTLAVFWFLSGLVTLLEPSRAISVLEERAISGWFSGATVYGGALADLALGLAILWRRWTKPAALGMLALSGAYLVGSLVVAPDLWADPLGPMVKVFPGMALAVLVWLLMEDR
ncbi:SDR family oxidoreductase [Thioclava sp. F28-4]|uniref:SDR family oxidoreductase n=1 Tax=Thioclava sp. F28-4 TaxID=1915315 RepID=UPI00099700F4|nr:SDR family oxidoreductase [Thioclava sp. F28-4]OOY05867.1 oxidoreductase [Thioclava sp. F28-4]